MIKLPDSTGTLTDYKLVGEPIILPKEIPSFNRIAFSAVHIVTDPFCTNEPSIASSIDWDATMAYRRYMLDTGLSIAEAMDTAQRGMDLDWNGALVLVQNTMSIVEPHEKEKIYSGVSTDQVDPATASNIDDVLSAYITQLNAIQKTGSRVILMASPALAKVARTPEDYKKVYKRILSEAEHPVILHWLGEMFDPRLKGYWGAECFEDALDIVLDIINTNTSKVDGIKLSLLDESKELILRRSLPASVRMYTGDDFNYPQLIAGDSEGYSDALLGIFDAIAPAASAALSALAQGNRNKYDILMNKTVPLSRLIFRAPTQYYKTGIVFLAYLNGFQNHFIMLGGKQSMRPLPYFVELFKLADQAKLLNDPEKAVKRMKDFLLLYGIGA